MGNEVKGLQRTKDGIAFEDGVLKLRDGREMAWRWWGEPGGKPLLRIQGTPSCCSPTVFSAFPRWAPAAAARTC